MASLTENLKSADDEERMEAALAVDEEAPAAVEEDWTHLIFLNFYRPSSAPRFLSRTGWSRRLVVGWKEEKGHYVNVCMCSTTDSYCCNVQLFECTEELHVNTLVQLSLFVYSYAPTCQPPAQQYWSTNNEHRHHYSKLQNDDHTKPIASNSSAPSHRNAFISRDTGVIV